MSTSPITTTTTTPARRLLRTKQASQYLSISPWKLRSLVARGKLAYLQLEEDGPWTFDVRDLDAYVDEHKEQKPDIVKLVCEGL